MWSKSSSCGLSELKRLPRSWLDRCCGERGKPTVQSSWDGVQSLWGSMSIGGWSAEWGTLQEWQKMARVPSENRGSGLLPAAKLLDGSKTNGRFYVTGLQPLQKFKGVDLTLGDFALVDVRCRLSEFGSQRTLGVFGLFAPCAELGGQFTITK